MALHMYTRTRPVKSPLAWADLNVTIIVFIFFKSVGPLLNQKNGITCLQTVLPILVQCHLQLPTIVIRVHKLCLASSPGPLLLQLKFWIDSPFSHTRRALAAPFQTPSPFSVILLAKKRWVCKYIYDVCILFAAIQTMTFFLRSTGQILTAAHLESCLSDQTIFWYEFIKLSMSRWT